MCHETFLLSEAFRLSGDDAPRKARQADSAFREGVPLRCLFRDIPGGASPGAFRGEARGPRGVTRVRAVETKTAPPRRFYTPLIEFLWSLQGSTQRFWVLVVLTGLASGLSAVLLVSFLRGVQHLAWAGAGEAFLPAVQGTPGVQRVLVTALAGGSSPACRSSPASRSRGTGRRPSSSPSG